MMKYHLAVAILLHFICLLDASIINTPRINKRSVAITRPYLWPGGKILMYITQDVPKERQLDILAAIKEWENDTCIKFDLKIGPVKRKDKKKKYIYIFPTDRKNHGCSAPVGRPETFHRILIGEKCNYGKILNALGHVIGLQNEHQRYDRNKYIDINETNIQDDKTMNFMLFDEGEMDTYNLMYDYESVMHYGPLKFSKNGYPVITPYPLPNGVIPVIGQRRYVSKCDRVLVSKMYGCYKKEQYDC